MINAKKAKFLTKIYKRINEFNKKKNDRCYIKRCIKSAISKGESSCDIEFDNYWVDLNIQLYLIELTKKYRKRGYLVEIKETRNRDYIIKHFFTVTIDWSKDSGK